MDQYEDIDIFEIDEALPPTREGARPDLEGNIGGQAVAQVLSGLYDRLAPSEESLAALREQERINKEIADRAGISEKQLYQMSAYGADTENILGDLGFKRYSLGDDLTRVRDFLFGSQKKGFNKLAEGTDFLDLTGEEMFGVVLAPLDALDYAGLGTALAKLATKGIAKYGGKSTLLDAAKDKELVGTLSQSEIMEVMKKLKPVIDGEQEALLRFAKGKPTDTKTTGSLTAKDEILGLGDDLRAPKQIQDIPTLKNETRPVKPIEVEGPVTIDDILKTTQSDLVGKKAFYNKDPEDIISTVEKFKNKKKDLNKAYKDKEVLKLNKILPNFAKLTDDEKYEAAVSFVNVLDSPTKKFALYDILKKTEKTTKKPTSIDSVYAYANRNNMIPEGLMGKSSKETVQFEPKAMKSNQEIIDVFNNLKKWKSSKAGKLDPTGRSLTGPRLDEIMNVEELTPKKRHDIIKILRDDLNNLGLTDISRPGTIKIPKSKSAKKLLKEMGLTTFPQDFQFATSGLLNPAQKVKYNKAVANLEKATKEKGLRSNAGVDFLTKAIGNRMLRQSFQQDIPVGRIIDKINNIDIEGVANIIERRNKYNNKIQEFIDLGYDVDQAQIGHVTAISEDALLALELDNLTLQSAKSNGKETGLRNKIKNILNNPDESPYKIEEVVQELEDLGIETKVGDNIYGKAKDIEKELQNLEIGASDAIFGYPMNEGGMVKNFAYGGDVTEDLDIFEAPEDSLPEGSYQTANLMLPFFKLFGKAPPHTTAPIPTPKEKLLNPTKKQKESLETETIKRSTEDIFDPTPNDRINIEESVTTTPITKQPMTSVFYSDVDRLLSRPDTPKTFNSKQEFFDFLNKNNIRKSESMDYRIPQILKLFGDTDPIDTATILTQVRTAPISGMRVHATGQGSEIINPNGAVNVRYSGYAEPGFIEGSQRERILYMNRDKLPGDSGDYPQSMFGGEQVHRHEFQIPNEQDTYIVGWTRLTDRFGFVPPKVTGPETQINLRQLNKEISKNNRTIKGLYAEAQSKIERLANQRGMSQADINQIMDDFDTSNFARDDTKKLQLSLGTIAKYADQLDEISPGLVNQLDELVVRNRELNETVQKASGVDPSGVVRVTYADEIQSDILQAAAMRKQQLAAALRKIQEEGKQSTNLQGLNRVSEAAINFFEENKSVFRPLEKSPEEMKLLNQQMLRLDEEVDNLVNKYIATRELDDAELAQLGTLLNDNIDKMLNEVMTIDGATMSGLFPDLPLKNREEWADALIKKDLYELAYRKYVLKDPNASDYYATATSNPVIERYGFDGNAATPKELRDIDKQQRFETFKRTGEFKSSKYKGIGMDEFYGGPNAVDEKGKHYTSTIEKILKKQAKENNSEVIIMPVQVKKGSKAQYQVTDQNGNMVATLTNEDQARDLIRTNPNYQIKPISIPDKKSMEPVFAIKITEEMLESFATHKAKGGLVSNIDIFEVA